MKLTLVYGVIAAFIATAALAQKPAPMTVDEVTAAVTGAGYTNVTGCAQKKPGKGAWHCSAVPASGGNPVPVTVDPHGGVHAGDSD